MTLDIASVLRDAWAMARRDAGVLVGLVGVLLFVPDVVQTAFVAPPPQLPEFRDPVAVEQWLQLVSAWARRYEFPVIGLALVSLLGTVALFMFYVDRDRLTVGGALARAATSLPVFVVLALMVQFPVSVGILVFLFPGLYLKGRLLPIVPLFVADRSVGLIGAWQRSFALTRGNGLVLMGLACVPILGGWLAALPFEAIGKAMNGAPMANPVVATLLTFGVAGAHTLAALAAILTEIALYRRLGNRR